MMRLGEAGERRAGRCASALTTTNSSPPMRATKSSSRTLARSTSRGMDQHGVARRVAERVVDLLEAVEIDMQQRDAAALGVGVLGALGSSIAVEIAAVGQAGQRVVQRVVLDARGGGDQLGVARLGQRLGAFEVALDGDVGGDVPVAADDARRCRRPRYSTLPMARMTRSLPSARRTRNSRHVAAAPGDGVVELALRAARSSGWSARSSARSGAADWPSRASRRVRSSGRPRRGCRCRCRIPTRRPRTCRAPARGGATAFRARCSRSPRARICRCRSLIRWRAMNSGISTSAMARTSPARNPVGSGCAAAQPPAGRAASCQLPSGTVTSERTG